MTVHDIPDLQWDGGDLGSVVFSESFLESSINIQHKGTVLIRLSLLIDSTKEIRFTYKQHKATGHCQQKMAKVILEQQR